MIPEYDEDKLIEAQSFFNLTGCGLNASRYVKTPQVSKIQMNKYNKALGAVPKIDLMNFQDPQFEDGKFVLTSPRSLEACFHLGVKPVDLLYKPLAEFQEELLDQDIPLRIIYNIYDEYQQNRERKLALCREERVRIMNEEKGMDPSSHIATFREVPVALVPKSHIRKSLTDGKKELSNSEKKLNARSLQRRKTAWTASSGHDIISNDEINHRVRDLQSESLKLKKELLSRKEDRMPRRTKSRKRQELSTKLLTSYHSHSVPNLRLTGTSILNRSENSYAQPMSNAKPRKTLQLSATSAAASAAPKDKKILKMGMSNYEVETADNDKKVLHDIQLERRKREEEAARLVSEMTRRQLLSEEYRNQPMNKSGDDMRRKEEQKSVDSQGNFLKAQQHSRVQKQRDRKIEKELPAQKTQECFVNAPEQTEEELKGSVSHKLDYQLNTASQFKEPIEESEKTMTKLQNERRQSENQWNRLLQETQECMESLMESTKSKEFKDKSTYKQMMQRKENERTMSRVYREKSAFQDELGEHEQEVEVWRDSFMANREAQLAQWIQAQGSQTQEGQAQGKQAQERHVRETMAQKIERQARRAVEERVEQDSEPTEAILHQFGVRLH